MSKTRNDGLTAAFLEEALCILPELRAGLEAAQAGAFALDGLSRLHRMAHNLKGASAMVGEEEVNRLATVIEEELDASAQKQEAPDPKQAAAMLEAIEALEAWTHAPEIWTGRLVDLADRLSRDQGPNKNVDQSPPEQAPLDKAGTDANTDANAESIPSELLEIFALEAEEHLQTISTLLPRWSSQPDDQELLQEIRRSAHTLKGAAGMVGMKAAQGLAHRMEDLLDALYDGTCPFSNEAVDILYSSFDLLERAAETSQGAFDSSDIDRRISALLDGTAVPSETAAPPLPRVTESQELPEEVEQSGVDQSQQSATDTGNGTGTGAGAYMRVRTDRLGEIVNLVGELSINRTAFERRLSLLVGEIDELAPSVAQLRAASTQLESEFELATLGSGGTVEAEGEFDELELDQYTEFHSLSRSIQERIDDISSVHLSMNRLLADFDQVVNRQRRLSTEIHDGLMRVRMVPFESVSGRLERTTQQAAHATGRTVAFRLHGGAIELDKAILDSVIEPLMHGLRNAVDHGIETPQERVEIGKPGLGLVQVSVEYEGTQIVVRIRDDGRGVNREQLRAKALSSGMIDQRQSEALKEEDVLDLIFLPGFSTATALSEVSGRGVGMDVIRAQVDKLGGKVLFESAEGVGSTLSLRIPMALAIMRTLTVAVGNEQYAIPLPSVDRVLRVPVAELRAAGSNLNVDGENIPTLWLARRLEVSAPEPNPEDLASVLVTRSIAGKLAVIVEHIEGAQDVVVKNFVSHSRRVRGFIGGTVTGDGAVLLILDPDALAERDRRREKLRAAMLAESRVVHTTSVLLVDDSLSVRRIVSSQLATAGMAVSTATNGEEALQMLDGMKILPDLIVLDIEMPKMDGFELMRLLRSSERYRAIPVAFQTSRAGEKHRARARELGAAAYLVKPYDQETLLAAIETLLENAP